MRLQQKTQTNCPGRTLGAGELLVIQGNYKGSEHEFGL